MWVLATVEPVPHPVPAGAEIRERLESPCERRERLIQPYRAEWAGVSPDVISAFYEHTQRDVTVSERAEVLITVDGVRHWFRPATGTLSNLTAPGAKLLAYFHPDFPDFLHLSTRDGRWVGTWPKVQLVSDADSLTAAIAASEAAVRTVRERAAELGSGERQRLEEMRERNAERLRFADAIEVAPAPAGAGLIEGVVAGQLATARETLAAAKRTQRREATAAATLTDDADDALMNQFGR